MAESDRLKRLAAGIAGDRPIDWDAQERDAPSEAERSAIRQLRVVAAVAGFHRSARTDQAGADLSASISIAQSVATPVQPVELPPGSPWGHLKILERVGRGGFGDVYRARDTRLDRIVALKLLATERTDSAADVVREARLLAKVRHPNVVTVFGADRVDGRVGIWMEFLEGETLDRMLRTRGTFDAREAALVGIDLCRALSAVHAAGIVHQDVKLGNIMRAEGGRIVLMDFGLGREFRARGSDSESIAGTPLFMAPEVLRGSHPDARSDVYSLGVVLFALVTGVHPVEATQLADLVAKHDRGERVRARERRTDLPEAFAQMLDHALAADPEQRFARPAEVEQALLGSLGAVVQSSLTQPRRAAPTALLAALAVALTAAVAVAIALGVRSSRRANILPSARAAIPLAALPAATLVGEGANDLFGLAVAGLGDVDQDGFDDVLVGAPHHGDGRNRGKVYLYRGAATGLSTLASWTAEGEDNDLFGWSLASSQSIADVGFADAIVGATAPVGIGRVFVYAGAKGGPSNRPSQTFTADRPATLFGYAVATGDVNHDGSDDLLVGEPFFPSEEIKSGRVHLYLSIDDLFAAQPAWIMSGPAGSSFGMSISMAGDLNHDGYADAVIGAPTATFGSDLTEYGAAYVYLGSQAGLDSVPTVLVGRQASSYFGISVDIAGDLDGDGFDDVAVGAEFATNGEHLEGVLVVHYGSKNGICAYSDVFLESNTMGANFAAQAGPVGDLDGDGCDDFFVGALRYQHTEPREGASFVYAGSRNRSFADPWFRVFGKAGSWFGAAGGSAGDVNGDGFLDFIAAAPSYDTDTSNQVGLVELFLNTRKR